MSINIQLEKFEGPLDLLLYLIRKEEMDIFDIQINKITGQYLEYIRMMKDLDLDMASDFIAMAATLIQIKSRMLLPQYDEHGEVVESEDPRKELVQRLLEYEKYKEASKLLYERPLLGRDLWTRGIREKLGTAEDLIILEENALFSLIGAYRNAMRSIKRKIHQVGARALSISGRILQIKDRLILGTRINFSDLIDSVEEKRQQVLITFLSLLELGKLGFVGLYQTDLYQEIYIETRKPVEADAISRVEEYDAVRSEELATAMMLPEETPVIVDEEHEFVLRDAEDFALEEGEDSSQFAATDEEILEAEMEMLDGKES